MRRAAENFFNYAIDLAGSGEMAEAETRFWPPAALSVTCENDVVVMFVGYDEALSRKVVSNFTKTLQNLLKKGFRI
jgi:hypothetical protein